MNYHIKVVAQLSKVVKCNKYNQKMESMYIDREEWMNILSYVDFSKLLHVIKYFPELNQKFGQEGITFLPYSSSIAIYWENKNLIEL